MHWYAWQSPKTRLGNSWRALAYLAERLQSPAEGPPGSLTHALYLRPTLDVEVQISILMRQPLAAVRPLLARTRLHNKCFEIRRSERARPEQVRRYCERIRLAQQQEYLDLVRMDRRSRIVASFHIGDYLYGAARLFSTESASRRKFVVSLNRSAAASFENLASGFDSSAPSIENELLLGSGSSTQLSGLLRDGSTSLLLFCDLPGGLTESAQVRFLDRSARFSIGPALLALANRVPLLPLLNFFDGSTNCVRLGKQIEPTLLESETLREGATRLTQELASLFESVFLEYPDQWRFTCLLPTYFRNSDTH